MRPAIDTDGEPASSAVGAAVSESTDAWVEFLAAPLTAGSRHPLLIVRDGAPGLIAAIEHVFPGTSRERCVIHRPRDAVGGSRSEITTPSVR